MRDKTRRRFVSDASEGGTLNLWREGMSTRNVLLATSLMWVLVVAFGCSMRESSERQRDDDLSPRAIDTAERVETPASAPLLLRMAPPEQPARSIGK